MPEPLRPDREAPHRASQGWLARGAHSFEQAVAAYESEAYQKALVVLSDSVERDFRIVEGID